MRSSEVKRKTTETAVIIKLNLDGKGESAIDTGSGFMDHMLTLLSRHSGFDLWVKCGGDKHVDLHHSVEDVGICLGQAFSQALGDMRGITRYASSVLPMDEALVLTAVDISGRSYLAYGLTLPAQKCGEFDTELVEEFLRAFVRTSNITLHVCQLAGSNTHHIIEACFKSLARTLKGAAAIDGKNPDAIPSTKGVL